MVCIPIILQRHGAEFFGLYSIQTAALVVIGLMDLGISRGILLVTYDRILNPSGSPNLPFKIGMRLTIWVSLALLLITLCVLWILDNLQALADDVLASTVLHAVSGSLTILTLPLRALLEIKGKFGLLNIIRSLLACSVPLAPLLPAFDVSQGLTSAATYVLLTRVAGFLAYRWACRLEPLKLRTMAEPERSWKRAFMRRCGWVGLTNAGSLILTYSDRFLLGGLTSATAVTSYVVAHELATKIWMVSGAVMSASQPTIAKDVLLQQVSGRLETPASVNRLKWIILGAVVAPSMLLTLFLEPLLGLWLGTGYPLDIAVAGKILIAGLALNSMSQLNFGLLQLLQGEAHGAFLQLANIVLALALMATLIPSYGAVGAAFAFSLRLAVDAFATRAMLMFQTVNGAGFRYRELSFVLVVFPLLWMIPNV